MTKTYTEEFFVSVERDLHTGHIRKEAWRDEAHRLHRGHGLPAVMEFEAGSTEPTHLEFRFRGLLERKDGPALMIIDPNSKVVVREEWYRNNERHREGGPAVVVRDQTSGEILHSENHKSTNVLYRTSTGPSPS